MEPPAVATGSKRFAGRVPNSCPTIDLEWVLSYSNGESV